MRIVSGTCRGRVISPPKNFKARPTTDFAKENLFNILSNRYDIEDLKVLDLFSGTGSISMEFASRGAKSVVSVEKDSLHQRFILSCSKDLKLDAVTSIRGDVFAFISSCREKFDLIFADPPYDMDKVDDLPDLILGSELLQNDGVFILEHSKSKNFSSHPNCYEQRSYGSVNFSFFKKD